MCEWSEKGELPKFADAYGMKLGLKSQNIFCHQLSQTVNYCLGTKYVDEGLTHEW